MTHPEDLPTEPMANECSICGKPLHLAGRVSFRSCTIAQCGPSCEAIYNERERASSGRSVDAADTIEEQEP